MDNKMNNGFSGESVNFIADEEAIKEIDIGQFLDKGSDDASVFEGFQEDIEKTEKSLENELNNLYDDIMSSGPATIVPKPLSVITSEEPEKTASESGLEELWMDPEEYFELDIPVVSLDDEDEDEDEEEEAIPEEAFFRPEPSEDPEETEETEGPETEKNFTAEEAKEDIFGMIDSMKTENESESGFGDILAEIAANTGIAEIDAEDFASVAGLLSTLPAPEIVEDEEEIVLEPSEEDVAEEEEVVSIPEDADSEDESDEDIFADAVIEVAEKEDETEADEEIIADVVVTDEPEAEEETEAPESDEISITEEISDTDSEEFRMELERLLGGNTATEEKEESEENADGGFIVNIPDDGSDYSFADNQQEADEDASAPIIYFGESTDAPVAEPVDEAKPERVIGDFEAAQRAAIEATAEETKEEKKARKQKEKDEKKKGEKKHIGAGEIVRRIVLSVAILVIIASGVILANTYIIQPSMAKKLYNDTVSNLQDGEKDYGNATVDTGVRDQYDVTFPEGMLAKYAPLYASNQDLKGWISIPAFEINLPVVQGNDNDYYLKRNIYKKWTEYGVPFFDFRIAENQFATLPRNTVIYGHNMRSDDLIFGMLEEYRDIDGFKRAPVIECNTIYGDFTWLVCGAFISNSVPEHDNGYVFPYNFIDCSDQKFMGYISELEKRRFYDTGVDLAVTDKILTLSTCCYDFPDARLVVVARLLRDGESVSVDTSKAIKNPDPKGPQIWFDENGRPNNYAYDARW